MDPFKIGDQFILDPREHGVEERNQGKKLLRVVYYFDIGSGLAEGGLKAELGSFPPKAFCFFNIGGEV